MSTSMKAKNLPETCTGFYGDWIGSYECAEHHVRIYQCGSILRCVQMSDCEGMPAGALRWQLNLTNMAGFALAESPCSTTSNSSCYNGTCPYKNSFRPVAMRLSVIDRDRICMTYGADKRRIIFTRNTE